MCHYFSILQYLAEAVFFSMDTESQNEECGIPPPAVSWDIKKE